MKEQKEEAERFQKKLKEMEDLKIESFLVQLFHINKAREESRNWVGRASTDIGTGREGHPSIIYEEEEGNMNRNSWEYKKMRQRLSPCHSYINRPRRQM